jgi:hypothetical protein
MGETRPGGRGYKGRLREIDMADGTTPALDAAPLALPHNIEAEQALLGATRWRRRSR